MKNANVAEIDWDELLDGPRPEEPSNPLGLPALDERALAELTGLSLSQVRTKAREGVFVRSARGRYDAAASVRAYIGKLRESAARAGRPSAGGDELKVEKLRLTRAQAEREETRVARERGELVSAEAVAREWSSILADVRAALLAVPSRFAASQPHLSAHDIATLGEEIRRALEGLADGN